MLIGLSSFARLCGQDRAIANGSFLSRTHVHVQEIAENRSTTQIATRVRTSTRFFTPKATQFEVRLQEAMFHTAQSIVQSIETNSTSNVSVELGGILKKTTNIGE